MRIRNVLILMVSLITGDTVHEAITEDIKDRTYKLTKQDPSYTVEHWNTRQTNIPITRNNACHEQRPFLSGADVAKWAWNKYSCTDEITKSADEFDYYLRCVYCQRDCYLDKDEVYNLDACDIDAIPAIGHNVPKKVGWLIFDTIAGNIGSLDPAPDRRRMFDDRSGVLDHEPVRRRELAFSFAMVGTAMTLGKGIFTALRNENALLDGVVVDVNDRVDRVIECFGQEIAKIQAEDVDGEISGCYKDYGLAVDLTEDKFGNVRDAWKCFTLVITRKFVKVDKDATYFRNLFMQMQDFAALYALLSVDWLTYWRLNRHDDYHVYLETVLNDFRILRTWVYTAEAVIVEDMWENLHKLPCRNDEEVKQQMREWKNTFEEGNIDPIEQYIAQFDKLKSMVLPGDVCENLDESAKVIHVLSTDHSATDYGKYFNFEEVEVDAIFGDNNWNGKTLRVYNERTGITEKIKLWNAEAGLETCVPMKTIKVLSVREDGKYFNFNEDDGDAIWGDTRWHDHSLRVYNRRKNGMFNVRLWRPKDGSAHGRSDRGAASGDWKVGDVLYYNRASGTEKHTSPCVSGECAKNSYGVWKCPSQCASGSRMVDGKCIAGDAHGRREDVTFASEGDWEVGDVLIYRPGDSYTTCGDEYECIQGTCQSSYTPIDDPSRPCSTRPTVEVLSVEHSEHGNGKYFNFDIAQMDAAMEEGNWETRAVPAYNYRTGRVINVYMWRADANGDSDGNGHGRLAYGERGTSDWQIGDELAFNLDSSECGEGFYCVPVGDDENSSICQHARCNADDKLPFIDVTSINREGESSFGQYFRFDAASIDLDNLLGADWESKTWKVYNSRTKEAMKIRIWSAEGGHGRKDPWDASTDAFHFGDRLVFNYGSADGCGDDLSCVPVGDDDDFACIAGLSFGDVVSLSE